MFFHVRLIDNPETPEKRGQSRLDHWRYFEDHRDHFIARGATKSDDEEVFLSSVLFVEFEDWAEVRSFVHNEPHNRNGVYNDVRINRWGHGLNPKRQRDFARRDDQVTWYIRGFGKPGMHPRRMDLLQNHLDYFAPFDKDRFIARGGVRSDDGNEWQGSANLIALPSRDAVQEFLDQEPFYKNGLYESVLVERYIFGGRPGQVV